MNPSPDEVEAANACDVDCGNPSPPADGKEVPVFPENNGPGVWVRDCLGREDVLGKRLEDKGKLFLGAGLLPLMVEEDIGIMGAGEDVGAPGVAPPRKEGMGGFGARMSRKGEAVPGARPLVTPFCSSLGDGRGISSQDWDILTSPSFVLGIVGAFFSGADVVGFP